MKPRVVHSALERGLLIATAVAVLASPAHAQDSDDDDDDESTLGGRFGFVLAARSNLGALGKDYAGGFALGFHAGIENQVSDTNWTVGLGLTTLFRGWYLFPRSDLVEQSLGFSEGSLGARILRRVATNNTFAFVTGGGVLSVSNVPLAPGDSRINLGSYVGVGAETGLWGEWSLAPELRYNNFVDGPQNITLMLRMVAGRR